MKTLISDMGGVIYSFDPSFVPQKHLDKFLSVTKKLINEGKAKNEEEAEYLAVTSGILPFYPIQNGIENLKKNMDFYSVVFVASAWVKTTEHILETLNVSQKNCQIVDITLFGSKKKIESWKSVFLELPSVDVIVEDWKENLTAADEAAKQLGFNPRCFQNMPALEA